MGLRLEAVENGADDRSSRREQLSLRPSDLIELGGSGSDDQKHCIHDIGDEKRIAHRQDRRRIDKHEAVRFRKGLDCASRFGPIDGS